MRPIMARVAFRHAFVTQKCEKCRPPPAMQTIASRSSLLLRTPVTSALSVAAAILLLPTLAHADEVTPTEPAKTEPAAVEPATVEPATVEPAKAEPVPVPVKSPPGYNVPVAPYPTPIDGP